MDLGDLRRRPLARHLAAARFEDVEAAAVLAAGADVRTVDSVVRRTTAGHPRDRRRSADLEIGNAIGTLIPSLQDQPAVVHAVVVVEMREERVRDVDGRCPLSIRR